MCGVKANKDTLGVRAGVKYEDLYHAAVWAYQHMREKAHAAIAGERARAQLLEQRMRGAGLIIPNDGPVAKWVAAWITQGVCPKPKKTIVRP